MASTSEDFVTLTDGSVLPRAALELAIDLELKGLRLTADNGTLRVSTVEGTRPDLSEEDRDAIRRWKLHLLHIAVLSVA